MKTYNKNNLPPHISKHSPTGMNWGYGGSGPSDLALSLLTDVVGREEAEKYYQDFKWLHVSNWDDSWSITSEEILEWYNKVRNE